MNDYGNVNCEHKHLRQTVQVIFSVTVGAWNKALTKQAIRSSDVQIEEVLWDAPKDYTYCADCGLVIYTDSSLYARIDHITQYTSNPTGKINRIKALRELASCGLKEAKYFVDSLYQDYGAGAQWPHLQEMVLEDVKRIIASYNPDNYNIILARWER